jgi:aquaporin Z
MKKLIAEFIGTLWLVLAGCGSAVLAASFPGAGIGPLGISLAFGLALLCMAYAIGHISGCHLNPAVTIGLWIGARFETKDLFGYISAQLLGAVAGAGLLWVMASGNGADLGSFAANGFGDLSPGKYSRMSAFVCETVMTFFFVLIILGSTDGRAPRGFAPIAIGLALVLVHLISIPITNTSVNPARSLSQALFAGGAYLGQVWLFWLAPILGAAMAGFAHKAFFKEM